MQKQEATHYLYAAILSLVHPAQFKTAASMAACAKVGVNIVSRRYGHLWPSVFTGITIIANRETPPHRDAQGWPAWFDLLASVGQDEYASLNILDLGAKVSYRPGDVNLICGRLLKHAVDGWKGSGRLAYAFYMRPMVAERFGLFVDAEWSKLSFYTDLMDPSFAKRHGMFQLYPH